MKKLWIIEAERHIGLREIKGSKHNSTIVRWLTSLKAWWHDDETAWCGTFVAHCIKTAGLKIPSAWYRARAWADWGQKLNNPVVGCIVVFSREGGGHVGFVVGQDAKGNLMVLGGNQGDSVKISAFSVDRVLAYRWPSDQMIPQSKPLPVLKSDGTLSKNES
jgi:uncharacterized protein (TIGR02594 family)